MDDGTLHRNFMGYTVQSARDMVALGISGIGDVQGAFAQNAKKLTQYAAALSDGCFPIERGRVLDEDDLLRRHVITRLMCDSRLDLRDVERRFRISFTDTFATELEELGGSGPYRTDGLLTLTPDAIELTPLGRTFVRNVCMVFDRHLRRKVAHTTPVFSRTV
jgi:oxygen-independent coproporphyrinogen-3 oxidase